MLARLVFPSSWSWNTIESAVNISFPNTSVQLRGPKKHVIEGTSMLQYDVFQQDTTKTHETVVHLAPSPPLDSPFSSSPPQRCSPSPSPALSLHLPQLGLTDIGTAYTSASKADEEINT